MTPELKPCPFCGGDAHTYRLNGTMQATCANASCLGSDVHAPVVMWNRRASPPPPVEVSDQMRSVADFVKHLDRLAAKNEAIFNAAIEEYRARYQAEHAALSAIGAKDAD